MPRVCKQRRTTLYGIQLISYRKGPTESPAPSNITLQVNRAHHHKTHWGQTAYTKVIVSIRAAAAVTNGPVPPHCFTLYTSSSQPWVIEVQLLLSSPLGVEIVCHQPEFPSGVCVCVSEDTRFPAIRNHYIGQVLIINKYEITISQLSNGNKPKQTLDACCETIDAVELPYTHTVLY